MCNLVNCTSEKTNYMIIYMSGKMGKKGFIYCKKDTYTINYVSDKMKYNAIDSTIRVCDE